MSDHQNRGTPTRSFWIISAAALAWNLMGIASYLMTVTMSPETLNALPEAERALYAGVPTWVTSSYAIAVFGGTLACVLLLARKTWAVPGFVVSLAAILAQMGHAFFMTPMIEVRGATSALLPLSIIAVAIYLVWFSRSARAKSWLS